MEKRINNPFDFEDYKILLTSDFSHRVSYNPSYSLRAYAKDLDVSVGYLSKIFNGKSEIAIDTAIKIFPKMGFSEDELSYIYPLVEWNTTKDLNKKNELGRKLRTHKSATKLKKEIKNDSRNQSTEFFMTYALVRSLKTFEEISKITNMFQIDEETVREAITQFINEGFVKVENNQYTPTEKDINILESYHNYSEFAFEMAQFFYHHYQKNNINDFQNEASCLILGIDEDTRKEIMALQEHYITTMLKISERCDNPTSFVFLNTLFLEKFL